MVCSLNVCFAETCCLKFLVFLSRTSPSVGQCVAKAKKNSSNVTGPAGTERYWSSWLASLIQTTLTGHSVDCARKMAPFCGISVWRKSSGNGAEAGNWQKQKLKLVSRHEGPAHHWPFSAVAARNPASPGTRRGANLILTKVIISGTMSPACA